MKNFWPLIRILTFIIVGVLNTVLIRPQDLGSLKNYMGYLLLILAATDIVYLLYKKLKT